MGDRFRKILEPWLGLTFALSITMVLNFLLSNISILFGVFGKLYGLTRTILVGIVIAYILNPLMVFFEDNSEEFIKNEKRRHLVAVVLSFVTVLAFVVVFFSILVPQVVDGITTVYNNRGSYVRTISSLLDSLNTTASSFNIDTHQVTEAVNAKVREVVGMIPSNIAGIISTSLNIGTSIFNVVISFILAVYFLIGKKSMVDGVNRLRHALVSDKDYETHTRFLRRCHNILISYVGCDLLDALIIGMANAIFMGITRMSYIPLVSTLVGVTNLVPTFGPIIGALGGALIILMENPWHSLWFLIFTMVLQTLDGYYIKPKLFGDSLGVPAVWILITIIVGGQMFGMVGVLLAIPFAAILTFVYQELILGALEGSGEEKGRQEPAEPGEGVPDSAAEEKKERFMFPKILDFLPIRSLFGEVEDAEIETLEENSEEAEAGKTAL